MSHLLVVLGLGLMVAGWRALAGGDRPGGVFMAALGLGCCALALAVLGLALLAGERAA